MAGRGSSQGPTAGRRSYRISPGFRLYQAAALVLCGVSTICIVSDIAIALAVLVLMPRQALAAVAALAAENGWPGPVGIAGCLVAGIGSLAIGGLVAWFSFEAALGTTTEILVRDDGRIAFRSRLREIVLEPGEIDAIANGAWYDPNRVTSVVRHRGGTLTLPNQFGDFGGFLATLRELNPSVEIRGF